MSMNGKSNEIRFKFPPDKEEKESVETFALPVADNQIEDAEYFNWNPDDINERNAFASLTAEIINEWQNDEEDRIWR